MRNKVFLLFTSLLLAVSINAQESWNEFENGLIIATKLNTIPPVAEDLLSENLTLFDAIPSDKKSFTRLIVDVKNEIFFGYKLLFVKSGEENKYKLTFSPLKTDYRLPQAASYDYSKFKQKALTKYPQEILVNDGDTLVLDLLENPKTGSKVQEFIKVTTKKSDNDFYFDQNVKPQPFKINDVTLNLPEFKTLLNKQVISEKEVFDARLPVVGFHFRDKGRYLLSLFPQTEPGFKEIGYIENNNMFFSNGGDQFQIISKENIIPFKGKWTLFGKFFPESETKIKVDKSLPFVTEGYYTLDEPKVKPKVIIIKLINWY